MKENRNISIQILRVCACLMVFLVHFGQRVSLNGTIRSFTDFGRFGVHLFFLISGFLAGKTFFGNSNINIKQYYIKRMIAILPLYYLVIIYYFITENILNVFYPVIPSDELSLGWLRYVFLLNGFFNSNTYFWSNLGITWTLPIFIFFYFIAPFTLRRVNSVRSSFFVWFIVYLITSILGKLYPCTIFSNLHLLFLGVVLYSCTRMGYHSIATVSFSCCAICMSILNHQTYAYVSIFSIIILTLTSIEHIHLPGWLQKTINVLDTYSYTLYLTHGVVFCSLLDRLTKLGTSTTLIALLAVLGTTLGTWIVGRYIEKPIQQGLRKRTVR